MIQRANARAEVNAKLYEPGQVRITRPVPIGGEIFMTYGSGHVIRRAEAEQQVQMAEMSLEEMSEMSLEEMSAIAEAAANEAAAAAAEAEAAENEARAAWAAAEAARAQVSE